MQADHQNAMAAKKRDYLRISQVAKATNLTVHQVRNYLDRKLLECAGRSSSEHSLFNEASIVLLKFIKAGVVAGLSLHELTPFIHVLADGKASHFNREKQKLLARVEQHLSELKVFKTILIQLQLTANRSTTITPTRRPTQERGSKPSDWST